MEFRELVLNNFMSYRRQKFSDIDSAGLTLIEGVNQDEGGSNGAGKSSLWDGISWALFGQTVRGLKGDEVVHRKYLCDCSVAITFDSGGRQFTITRYRKHNDMGDRLLVTDSDSGVELGTTAQTQEWIEQEFGIDFELFRCTVLFAQGETFNFVNAGNKSQKEILSKVMRIDYDKFLFKAKEKAKELEKEDIKIHNELMVLNSHIVDDPAGLYMEESKRWESARSERIDELNAEVDALRNKKFGGPNKEEINKLLTEVLEKKGKLDTLCNKYLEERATAEANRKIYDNNIKAFQKLTKECPTCRQDIDSEFHRNCMDQFAKLRDQFAAEGDKYNDKLIRLEGEGDKFDEKRTELIKKLEEARAIEREREYNKKEIALAELNIKGLYSQENPHHELIRQAVEKQKKIKDKIAKVEARQIEIVDELPYYQFWVNAFGDAGIKSFVFDLICSSLTNKTNNYLNTLTGGAVSVAFDTQKKLKSGETREKFECAIIKDGEAVRYESYSGGEKRRISLAVDLALSDLMCDYSGTKFNLVAFDEQTTGLDLAGRQAFMELLKKISLTKRVFVVDHDAEFKSMFDDVWAITKKDGVSRCP